MRTKTSWSACAPIVTPRAAPTPHGHVPRRDTQLTCTHPATTVHVPHCRQAMEHEDTELDHVDDDEDEDELVGLRADCDAAS